LSGETYPATVGQLSVWRDIERFPPDRLWEANLSVVWDLPDGSWSEEQIWSALGAVAMRHASMRTTYVIDDEGFPRQRIAADTAEEVLVRDLDMGLLTEVRDLWAFYRDRRPDTYDSLTKA